LLSQDTIIRKKRLQTIDLITIFPNEKKKKTPSVTEIIQKVKKLRGKIEQ
jgi:hypothetical protein